ncbi:MAG TPA: tetratricopeptide repeat protein, partial [Cryomorphaceae bacterium]|nr:tetratricopeptide repeat protein [Cryomorphaceae bacterium]
MKTPVLSFFILVSIVASCGQEQRSENSEQRLGVVDLEVTGSEEALPKFERGLLLLHSFEYVDAREAFREAKERDPNMAMAYWGEALTYNHSLWRNQKYNEARDVVDSLDALDVDLTPIENDLIETLHVLYKPDTEK